MRLVIFGRISLLNEHLIRRCLLIQPSLCFPTLIRPTETKREIRLATFHHLLQRFLQQLFAAEPVMPVAESFYSCLAR